MNFAEDIIARLGITYRTLTWHLGNIRAKFNVRKMRQVIPLMNVVEAHEYPDLIFSRREGEAIKLYSNGENIDDIAVLLGISKKRVNELLSNVCLKNNCNSRFQMAFLYHMMNSKTTNKKD